MASSADKRLEKSTKFPPEFNKKVDMRKVEFGVMRKWIIDRLNQLQEREDDIVTDLCVTLLEGERYPDIKNIQIQMTGFLHKLAASFCKELWNELLDAQESPLGVPSRLLEAKKQELMKEKLEADEAGDPKRPFNSDSEGRDREIADTNSRDRQERGNFRGRSDRRAHQGARGFDNYGRSGFNRNQSPPPNNVPRGRRESHSPRGRERDGDSWRRGRSPSRSRLVARRSRSRSPGRGISCSPTRSWRNDLSSTSGFHRRANRYRPREDAREGRARSRGSRSRSRSRSPRRRSPVHKRRRSSSSRSRSPKRRRSYSPRSSRSASRSRSRSISRTPRRGKPRSQYNSRRRRNFRTRRLGSYASGSGGPSSISRGRTSSAEAPSSARRRNTSSLSSGSLRPSRRTSTDYSEDEPSAPAPAPNAQSLLEHEDRDIARAARKQRAQELKEMLRIRREQLMHEGPVGTATKHPVEPTANNPTDETAPDNKDNQ